MAHATQVSPVGKEVSILDLLAPERIAITDNLEQAIELANTDSYTRREIALVQLFLDTDLSLAIGDETYRVTERAFEHLCGLVKVPVSFAREIPSDLIAAIVERLKRLHQQTVVMVHRDETVVGLVDPLRWTKTRAKTRRPHYRPVSNSRVLQMIKNFGNQRDGHLSISIADSGLSIEQVGDEFTIEPRPGDITRAGLLITSSETGGPMPAARAYTLRLICTNGAVAPRQFGIAYLSTDWRVSIERRMDAFESELMKFTMNIRLLNEAYKRISDEALIDAVFVSLYRQALYVYRNTSDPHVLADRALGVPHDLRVRIMHEVRARDFRRRRDPGRGESAQLTTLAAWDVFNSITSEARGQDVHRRLALQKLGGDLIALFAPQELPKRTNVGTGIYKRD